MSLSFDALPAQIAELSKKIDTLQEFISNQESVPKTLKQKFLRVKEAAALTRLSEQTIYTKAMKNEIPLIRRGRTLLFEESALIDWINNK